MSSAEVDVVVVGGGIQGLVTLRELNAEGYVSALVTDAPLGGHQTLHSHGALASGTGLVTGALRRSVESVTVPYLEDRGVVVHREEPALLLAPDGMLAELAPVWEANDYSPEPVDPGIVPGLRSDAPAFRVPACNVDKGEMVRGLAGGLEPHVVGGRVVEHGDDGLGVRTADGDLTLRTRAVVVAAGCGTQPLLRDVLGIDGGLVERITYATLHMLCLRAPLEVLPTVGALVSADVLVVGHHRDGLAASPAVSTWYVTPVDRGAAPLSTAPADAVAAVQPDLVARGIDALTRMVPALEDAGSAVRGAVFAGYKQDVGGEPTRPLCELVDDERNVVVNLPSVLANAVPNARDTVALLRERVPPSGGGIPDLPRAGAVAVGAAHEDHQEWRGWPDFVRAYAG